MTKTATSPLRAGVIGAGVFGGYHAGKYVENPDTTLTAIFDPDAERAQALAGQHDATPYSDLDAFLQAVDVVTIASPGVTHAEMGARALMAGKPVLIEKPLAVTGEEADRLVALAAEHDLVLACGHQERLVFDVMGLTAIQTPPKRITAWREGPWSGRSTDISVTFDLMVHDLDLALTLIGQSEAETLSS
jgi:predicted dehydrogenase